MSTKQIAWNTGSGNINVEYGGSKDGTIVVTSDNNNLYESRSQQIKVRTTDGSNIERTITIQQAAKVRIDISTAIVTAANQTYSGSAKTPTPVVTLNGETVPSSGYDVAYSNNANAGTATITIAGKGDYTGTATGTFVIAQREVALTWGDTSWTYDKSAHSTTCTAGNLVTGDTCTVTLTGNSITNKGTTTVTASSLSNSNYKLPSANTTTLTVNARVVTLSWGTLSWTYDGSAHSTTCTAGNLCSGDTCTVTLTGNSITNAGSTTVTASSLNNSNYTLPSANTKVISITAKVVSLIWGTTSWVYDASAHSTTCTAGSLVSGDKCTVTLTGNSITSKGTTTVTASSLSNSNYTLPSGKTATLTITARPINVAASSASKTYDGTALTSNSATAEAAGTNRGLVSGHSMTSCTVTGTITNAGSASNVPSAAVIKTSGGTEVTSNYDITYVNGTLAVSKAAGSISYATTSVSKTYGNSVFTNTLTKSGDGGVTYASSDTSVATVNSSGQVTIVKAGSCTITATVSDGTNYTYATKTASYSLSVAKANPVYVAPTANNRTYNTSSAALLVAGSNTTPGSFTYSTSQSGTYSTTIPSQTNAGTYTTWWKFTPTDTTNYNSIGATSVSTTISAKTVSSPTITLSQSTYTYSGSACTPTATVKDGSTTISSSEYTVSYSNNTNAGTATVTITDKSGGNYTVSGSTTFTINKANPTYTAPTAITGLTYSGSSQYLVNAGSTSHGTIQYSSNGSTWSTTRPSSINAGSYTTYWRLVGDSNHNDVASTSLSTTIAKISRTLSFADGYVVLDTSSNITKTATPSAGSGDGAITYSISSTTYATINSSSGKVTSKTSDGSAIVTATITEGTNYLSATASYNLYVFATTHNYDYNGSYREVTLPQGTYQFQCWGAQGGSNGTNSSYGITAQAGGKGGYSVGQLTVSQATGVRVYVGGAGSSTSGGYNGGGSTSGSSSYNSGDEFGYSKMGGGGGATDIRLSDGALLSRMIVAGGGSGGAMYYKEETITVTSWENVTYHSNISTLKHPNATSSVWMIPISYFINGKTYKIYSPSSQVYVINVDYYNSGTWVETVSHGSVEATFTVETSGVTLVGVAIGTTVNATTVTDAVYLDVEETSTTTDTYNDYQVGFVGGGTNGGGYSSSYKGKQNAAGSGGSFGQGANQTTTNYRYCSGAGGGGWYGGGMDYGDGDMDYVKCSGGGSGFVNTAASAGNRPSGYTGLQLDSGETKAGNTSFPAPVGGNETGHSGNGYARITRIS